ncbi:pseudouridine synthase [Daedalea quercina L-15889]|uniref:Pseudouridine synthase n=1 Tax=Daedalea quercina L-15889 TaxID=1314783 RepID=A0A165QC89_9APHY|nr:pseudouridine synthase [Daedalea quercina L-15889]
MFLVRSSLCLRWQFRRPCPLSKLVRPLFMETLPEKTSSPRSMGKRPQESCVLDPSAAFKRPRLSGEAEQGLTPTSALLEDVSPVSVRPQSSGTSGKQKVKGKAGRRGTRKEAESMNSDEPKAPRLPKRMCALLIGFRGTDYQGMQYQVDPNVRTIEGTLFNALVRAGAVSKDNADDPMKVSIRRAARTDAGVHAAGNVVAMKLINNVPGVPDLVARINEELPPEIRLWSMLRVNNSFVARSLCDSRKYTYYFPSYALIPPKPGSGLHEALQQNGTELPSHLFWSASDSELDPESELRRKRAYRMPPDALKSLRTMARKFLGTHNFHNFTVKRDFQDRSCSRHMKDISVSDPVVYGNTEWVSVLFHGQSFMLHQRKMMTALILACRTRSPPELIDELYGPRNVFIPKMPALGLLLEYPIFDVYNERAAVGNEKIEPSDPQYRPAITFENHQEQIDKFKNEHIYPSMRGIEDSEGVFDAWIRSIDAYSGDDLLWLNSKGVIPAAAVIQRGVRRPNRFIERRYFDATGRAIAAAGESVAEEEEEEEGEEEVLDKAKLADMEG